MNRTTPPAAPAFEDLPPRRSPAAGVRNDLAVSLEIVTPILGGGYRARTPDDVDHIRVPTVRGQLRFWWRALSAGRFEKSTSLHVGEATEDPSPGRQHRCAWIRDRQSVAAANASSIESWCGARREREHEACECAERGGSDAESGRDPLVLVRSACHPGQRHSMDHSSRWQSSDLALPIAGHSEHGGSLRVATCMNDPGDLLPRSNDGTGVLEESGTGRHACMVDPCPTPDRRVGGVMRRTFHRR